MGRYVVLSLLLSFLYCSQSSAQSYAPFAQKLQTLVERIDQAEIQYREQKAVAQQYAQAHSLPLSAELPNGNLFTLQSISNGHPLYYHGQSVVSAKTLRSNLVWNGGGAGLSLDGSGQTLGVWDESAVRSTHQEFMNTGTSRVTQGDNSTSISMHATHVSGTMIGAGVNAPARGMSNGASIKAFDWNNDQSEMRSAASQWMKTSNHSYGLITGWIYGLLGDAKWVWMGDPNISTTSDYRFGFYTSQSRQWDLIANDYPYYLICKAAGNDRGEGPAPGTQHWVYQNGAWSLSTSTRDADGGSAGFDCIEGVGLSKNLLTVGAVYSDTNYTGPSSVTMTSFSGWGPTDDGRIKPDIVSMGVSEYSSYGSADNAYAYMSGTSMATPGVTGSLGLLLQHQTNLKGSNSPLRSSTLRALVIHSADEAGPSAGPDYKFGWGLVNIARAASIMSQNAARSQDFDVKEMTLTSGQAIDISGYSAGSTPIKVTIAWNDPAGTPASASLNPTTPMLVNDVDLRLLKGQSTYAPWILNPASPSSAATTGDNTRDNVEQVQIDQPSAGTYTIHITNKGSLVNGSQIVSLVISGLQPPGLVVNAGSPVSVCNGTSANLQGSVAGASNPSYAWTVDGSSTVLSTSLAYTANPTSTTTYRLTVTDGSQTASATVTVTVVAIPTASAGADVSINAGQSTTLTASTAGNASSTVYAWMIAGTTTVLSTSTSYTIQPSATQAYVLKTYAPGTPCASNDTVVVTVNAVSVTANAGTDKTICSGSSFTTTGSYTGTGTLDFKWIDLSTAQVVSTSATLTAAPTTTRQYAFRVTDQYANVATDTMVVTVLGTSWNLNAPSASAAPCNGCIVKYTVDSISGMTYSWTVTNGTIISGASSRQVTVSWSSTATTGTLALTETYGSCTKSRTDTYQLIPLPTPDFPVANSCLSDTKTYTASDASGVSYAWSIPSGGGSIISGANSRTVTIKWSSAGSRSVKLIETKNTGCANSTTKTLTVLSKPSPSISVNNSSSPRVGQTRVYSTTASGVTNYWVVSGGSIVNGQNSSSVTVQWQVPGMGSVTLMQTNTSTGCSAYVSKSISIMNAQSLFSEAPVATLGIFPNPAHSTITVEAPMFDPENPVEIIVTSLIGQTFIRQTESINASSMRSTLDITDLACGVYIVTIRNGEYAQSATFVKE